MSEQKRWYAPEVRRWRGGAASRSQAVSGGCFSAYLAVCFSGIMLFTDHGPVASTLQWLCICGLVFVAYRHFAHAAFNTSSEPEAGPAGPGGGP